MKLKEQILKRGLKIKWVAEQIGISNNLLCQYLNEKRPMPFRIEERIKKVLC